MFHTTFPADSYIIYNKGDINEKDRKIITLLYQPIIGHTAVSLYLTLLDDLDKKEVISNDFNHYHLMTTMGVKLDIIIKARQKLEAVGLLKTYIKEGDINSYVYVLYSPLTVSEFINHPILGVILYNNLGKNEYQKIVNYLSVPKLNLKDYQDISAKFNDIFTPVNGSYNLLNDELISKEKSDIKITELIDIELLKESLPKNIISPKCLNEEIIELLNNLYYIYKLDMEVLISLVRDNINERGLIDKQALRKACRNYYQFENSGRLPTVVYKTQPEYLRSPDGNSKRDRLIHSFETTSPYDFLASKCKNGEPSAKDVHLIESLMIDRRLNPGVVNVLISYVLHVNNQKLTKNYVDTIASQWQRLNIETVEEAIKQTEKEYKKNNKGNKTSAGYSKNIQNNEKLPTWFNKNIESNEASIEEQEEMNKMLSEML